MMQFRLIDLLFAIALAALIVQSIRHEKGFHVVNRNERMLDQDVRSQGNMLRTHRMLIEALESNHRHIRRRVWWLDADVIELEVMADKYRPANLGETEAIFFRAWRTLGHWLYDLIHTWIEPPA